jgi:hypothetical protein
MTNMTNDSFAAGHVENEVGGEGGRKIFGRAEPQRPGAFIYIPTWTRVNINPGPITYSVTVLPAAIEGTFLFTRYLT